LAKEFQHRGKSQDMSATISYFDGKQKDVKNKIISKKSSDYNNIMNLNKKKRFSNTSTNFLAEYNIKKNTDIHNDENMYNNTFSALNDPNNRLLVNSSVSMPVFNRLNQHINEEERINDTPSTFVLAKAEDFVAD